MRGQRHAPAALYPRERPGTHCTRGSVGHRAGLDRCGKSRPPTGIRSPDRPARSQSLYRLPYPARCYCSTPVKFYHKNQVLSRNILVDVQVKISSLIYTLIFSARLGKFRHFESYGKTFHKTLIYFVLINRKGF